MSPEALPAVWPIRPPDESRDKQACQKSDGNASERVPIRLRPSQNAHDGGLHLLHGVRPSAFASLRLIAILLLDR